MITYDETYVNKICDEAIEKIQEFLQNKDFGNAEILIDQYLRVKDDWKARQIATMIKMHLRKFAEAKKLCLHNIKEHGLAEDYNNLGLIARAQNNKRLAYKYAKKAYEIKKDNPAIIGNFAIISQITQRHKQALRLINEAIELDPKNWMYAFNKAAMVSETGKVRLAKKEFEKTLSLNPLEPTVNMDYFYCLMNLRMYKKAWHHYEFRYNKIGQLKKYIAKLDRPVLQIKKDLYEEKICIIPEQGMGDNLMFLRFVKEFQKKAPNSYYLCPEPLVKFVDEVDIKKCSDMPEDTEFLISIMSLPYHLSISEIPSFVLNKKHEPKKTEKIKIGICWAGSPYHPMDITRSANFLAFKPFLDDPDFEIYSFQKDRRPRCYVNEKGLFDYSKGFENYPHIIDLSDELTDAMRTAECMDKIDVFVSVDTFPIHIAGSVGVPSYVLVSEYPDWRWGKKLSKSDWYQSVEIVRKSRRKSFEKIIFDLHKKIRNEHFVRS